MDIPHSINEKKIIVNFSEASLAPIDGHFVCLVKLIFKAQLNDEKTNGLEYFGGFSFYEDLKLKGYMPNDQILSDYIYPYLRDKLIKPLKKDIISLERNKDMKIEESFTKALNVEFYDKDFYLFLQSQELKRSKNRRKLEK